MIKKIIAITMMVALVVSQGGIAFGAFTSDVKLPAITATVTLAGSVEKELAVAVKTIGGAVTPNIGWSGIVQGTTTWKASDQYIEVGYVANQAGWGVQVYTDNMAVTASPKYTGDPLADPNQQPAGLIGKDNTLLVCPAAVLVTDDALAAGNIQVPVTTTTADLPILDPAYAIPGDPDYGIWFTSGYDKVAGGDSEKVWFWLKDRNSTKWVDTNSNTTVDTGELVAAFTDGDDAASVVNSRGLASGWSVGGNMVRDFELGAKDQTVNGKSAYSLNVYVAADFTNAREMQDYTTNTLTLELYHQ